MATSQTKIRAASSTVITMRKADPYGRELRMRMADERQVEGKEKIRRSNVQLREDGSQKQRLLE